MFNILTIDGGGIRGVVPAHILERLEATSNFSPETHFQMVAGTSTGAIIAAAIACGIKLSAIVGLYKDNGHRIFKRKKINFTPSALHTLFSSLYRKHELEELLKQIFKDRKLGDITIPLLLPATDIGNGGVHVFKSAYSSSFVRDSGVFVRDAILASCSAPTYFDPTKVGEYALADGGLWANNPSLVATIEAHHRLKIDIQKIRILTLGTGLSRQYYGLNLEKKWGFLNGWRRKYFINFLLSLQSQSANNYLRLILPKEQVMRLDFESDTELPLDDASKVNDLISRADKLFTHECENLRNFLSIT